MKYSEIRDWVCNYLEHCSKEDMVDLYNKLGYGAVYSRDPKDGHVLRDDIEWDE